MNYTMKVLLENCENYKEKHIVHAIEESEKVNLDNVMVSNLYKSAIDKAHIDFDNIPDSKGDIEKYEGYPNMVASLNTIKELAKKQNIKVEEVEVVERALTNLIAYKKVYQDGFALGKDFVVLQYNTLVLACIEATSSIIISYMDFINRPNAIEFTIIKDKKNSGSHCINILRKFNDSVRTGEYQKLLNAIVNHKEGFMGMDTAIIAMTVVGGALVIVPLLRELIFYFFYSRMKVSEYLQLQAMMLEINKNHVESLSVPAKKKKEILKKQEQTISKMYKLSEKLKVSQKLATTKSMEEVKKEEKKWTLDNLKQEVINTDNTFTLL